MRDQRDRRDLDHRLNDEMVLTLSASGTADDVAGRINTLLEAGLQAVLFPLTADGDARGAILQTIEALS
jgi:alkanesulfonate monooxygenase SsuD/methylene tetrahydromethanopterin reductase-like flavin-dependent oxidoreductase (luciferase family)